MDLFEQALARVNSTNTGFRVDNSEELARQREEQRRQNELSRIDRANESAMSNANFIDNRVASLVNEWTPSRNKPQYTKFATKTDAVDANIPQDHPLAGLAGKVKATLQDKLANSQGTGKTFAQLEKEAFDENINSDTMIKAFEYKAKADSSWRNAFNIFGEDKDVKIPDKLQPAYNKWKSGIMEEQKARPELNSDPNAYHYAGGALLGAASGIVAAALAAPATAGTSLAAIPLLTAAATEGTLAAGGVYAGKKLQQAYRKSEAGTFHQGNSQDKTIGAILSGALMAAGARNSGAIGLTTMGAVGAGIGAVSPDSAFNLAGWIGTSALAHKAGMYGLKSALEAGKVSDSVRNALSSNADARAVIGEFDKLQSIKAKQAAITAAEFDAAARKTAAEFDKIREASKSYISTEDALWNDPNWRLSGDRYTNSDTINIINDFNNELRNSSPGGRNVLANSVDTRPKFPMAGRGKKRVAVVPVEEIEKERSNMHFNEFLSEMQSTAEDMRRAEQLKAIAEDENYKDLYENVMYSGSKAEAFDAVSTDGLSRAFGDGPGGNWKMLSLGSRMQIVSAEESASASLFARSVGEVSSADRLNELKKPLIKALRGALNETPEKFGDILRETVEKHSSAYMLDGQLNLNQLQQDLQHYGFDSLHQFAFKLAEESPALMRSQKKLTKLQEASEAIRQMAGMGVTKLGVAAAVGTGAYSFLNNKEAEAGVITPELMEELGKAGTKLWNYSMQRVTPEVADTLLLTIQEQLAQKMDLGKLFAGTAIATTVPTTVIAADQQGDLKGQSVLNTAIDYGKRALEGLGSLLGPKEADAATLEMLAKMSQEAKVSPAVVDYIKESKDPISAVLKKVSDAGLLFKRLPKDAISARGFRASYLQTAPKTENEITKIIAGTQQVFPGQNSLTSPNFGVMTMFNDVKTDDAFIGNIAVQLAHGQSVVADNTRKSLDVVKNIIDRYGIKTSSENSKAITKYMQPVQKEVENVSFPLRAKELALYENKKALEEFKESIGNDPEVLAKSAEELAIREAYNKQLTDEVAKLNEELIPQQNKLTEAYKHLAARYPETRISLACEDTADFQKYPWLQAAIEPHEQKAVLAIKDMMQEYRERITDIMGKKSVISGDFMKHSRYVDPDIIKQMQDLQEEFSRRGLRGEEIIALTKLHSRTKYSMQMIPDVTRNIGEYIPDVETRLMNADLWKVGKPGGWDMVRKSSIVQNSPTLKSMFDRIADSAKPVEETVLRKLSTNYAKLESTRLLFGSLSAPFKHALKLVGDLRTAPVMTIKSMPRALATAGRNFIASKLESLERLGYVEKGYASSVFKNTRALDDFVAGTINQRGMMDYLTDIETRYGAADQSTLNKLFSGVQDATSVGIKAVETFDRSTSVLMAMRMADKKGMTGQQAMYYIYDTILKNNFLSGQLNASWARDPNIRALMLFQNTPFKMWERRIADAVNMKKDIKTAWGIIRNTELPAAYEELQGIGRLMKQAEISFKSGMIRDSLTRDVAGQSTSKLLMREMLLIGGMLALGNKMGINLTGHLLHTPFVKTDEGDVKVSVSPVAQAVVKTAHGVQPAGFPDYTPEDHFAVSNFLRHWYGTSGPLLIGHKMKRLSENDIPDLYKNSKWKFLFSIPASE